MTNYPVKDGTLTAQKLDEIIKAGKSGLKLTDQQIRQLRGAVRAQNRAAEAAQALIKRG